MFACYGETNRASCKSLHFLFLQDINACHYGVAIGIIAFIGASVFFVSDLVFPSISSAGKRKKIVIADMGFSSMFQAVFVEYPLPDDIIY